MIKKLPDIAFFAAAVLSIINIFAAAFGLGPALTWLTGVEFWSSITTPLALLGIGVLIYSWVNSLLSNLSGMGIYIVNVALAPFAYGLLGLPYAVALAIAMAPLPIYWGLGWLSEKLESDR